ncbi:uncharacterized protein LOC128207967 [Mya arenaria]|uniref:uncharacterized protein LOC128207967 n=1 Tax=Mya arenaria TaxID=6604 RepID=UPI0022E7B1B9|nr:uncharacterized protein LOC128207967 [Mya arenaria]
MWCPTCVRWRNELQQHILRLNMTYSESWKWQNSYKEIASLCVPQKWSSVPTISDVSYCTNIWKNCTAFKINENVLQELQTVRNELIAHSSDGKLSDDETARVFDAVESVFKDRDVIPHIDAKNLTQHLLLIKNQAPTALTHFIKTCSKTLEEAKAKLKDLDEIPVQNQTKQRRILKYSERHVSRCIQGLIVALVIWWLFPTLQHSDYDKGCFQENYEYPFQQDLPLIGYFKTHKPLIGREWLFAKIQDSLEQTKPRGVLLLAQMGYGKSALISHLLCAKRNEKGDTFETKWLHFIYANLM